MRVVVTIRNDRDRNEFYERGSIIRLDNPISLELIYNEEYDTYDLQVYTKNLLYIFYDVDSEIKGRDVAFDIKELDLIKLVAEDLESQNITVQTKTEIENDTINLSSGDPLKPKKYF